ncbi:MAG TPA: PadR family transcriptional regulator [Anaerolineaceae bacterium]|nr:PadR family transcriptional regulator [Anaerolineaceae bacterium]
MSIEFAILGILSWKPLSGYDLKKMVEGSTALYWSGNNNEIYRTLVSLHDRGLVTREILPQQNYPARKIYTITTKGQVELKKWVLSKPTLPQRKHTLLIQVAWADQAAPDELDTLLQEYEDEVYTETLLITAQRQSKAGRLAYLDVSQARTKREAYLWSMIQENETTYYQNELSWVRKLRQGLCEL